MHVGESGNPRGDQLGRCRIDRVDGVVLAALGAQVTTVVREPIRRPRAFVTHHRRREPCAAAGFPDRDGCPQLREATVA